MLTFVNDEVKGKPSSSKKVFTPAVYVTAYPFECRNLSARLFYKRSFRMPTFNDLANRLHRGRCRSINTLNVDKAEIQHRPSELLAFGICYYLVFNAIIIHIGANTESSQETASGKPVDQSEIILVYPLRRY